MMETSPVFEKIIKLLEEDKINYQLFEDIQDFKELVNPIINSFSV